MPCIFGESVCETCGKGFSWRIHHTQKPRRFCNRKCTNSDFGIKGNKDRLFWTIATEEQKKERMKKFFDEKVIRKEGCWKWNGGLDKNGYPYINSHNGKRNMPYKAHRFSYEVHKGEIPKGKRVCHACDNPTCTNPEHLWIGTAKENSRDAVKKGRIKLGIKKWNAKLTDENVLEIRKLLDIGVCGAKIARKYNVTYMVINNIKHGKTWKHVK